MPTNRSLRAMNRANRMLQLVTAGRLGWALGGMPVLELTTTGRKSGRPRTTLLTSPLQVDGGWVVVASRVGDDVNPAWYLNLRDNPNVTVRTQGGTTRPMTARIATDAERSLWWPRITADHRNYADYQSRTAREIPLVLLTP